MSEDNKQKQEHGINNKLSLSALLEMYYRKGYIKENTPKYKTGYPAINSTQFKSDHLITFEDGESWAIHTTSSVRTDRGKQLQWDALYLKKLNSQIKKVLMVYPEGLSHKEQNHALSYQRQIREKNMVSAIDDCISQGELDRMIEEKALASRVSGQRKALEGTNLEEKLVYILNNSSNKDKWNQKGKSQVGYLYPYFEQILKAIGVNSAEQIKFIEARKDIPRLPSRGQAKTDVLLKIMTDVRKEIHTFSLKRSSANKVSIHQYKADDFIRVLNVTDPKMITAFRDFQTCGGFKELKAKFPQSYAQMEAHLKSYNVPLARWAYAGIGGEGKPSIQWARHMVVYKNETDTMEIFPMDAYIKLILNNVEGQLGTPFQWTFPSKNKGKYIQLKGAIL